MHNYYWFLGILSLLTVAWCTTISLAMRLFGVSSLLRFEENFVLKHARNKARNQTWNIIWSNAQACSQQILSNKLETFAVLFELCFESIVFAANIFDFSAGFIPKKSPACWHGIWPKHYWNYVVLESFTGANVQKNIGKSRNVQHHCFELVYFVEKSAIRFFKLPKKNADAKWSPINHGLGCLTSVIWPFILTCLTFCLYYANVSHFKDGWAVNFGVYDKEIIWFPS